MAVQNTERSIVLHGLVPGLEAMSLAAALEENHVEGNTMMTAVIILVMNGKFKCMWTRETFWSIYCSQFRFIHKDNFLSILKGVLNRGSLVQLLLAYSCFFFHNVRVQ